MDAPNFLGDGALPDIAIIITAHNYGRYLDQCLDSIVQQTRLPEEVVIVDDASTDETPQVIERRASQLEGHFRTRVIRHGARVGFAGSLNEGIWASQSELFAHVDADDVCLPRYLEALEEALFEHPNAAYAYPRIRLTGNESGVYRSHPFDPARLIFEGNYIPNVALVRRSAFNDTDGYRPLRTHLDWDLWLDMLAHGHRGVLVDEVLYEWHRHAGAMTYQSAASRLRVRLSILIRHRRLVARHSPSSIAWTARALGRRLGLTNERRSSSGWLER